MTIQHISDTARWVAVYRAMESERPDAIFRDPYARRLAGETGERIVQELRRGRQMAWALIVRTALFDELILDRVNHHGADLVLNLAAGLDTRPWRLKLPADLHWVDVDLPDILRYKTESLASERAICRYEAVTTDLTDAAARAALFSRFSADHKRVLVVTEGLLIYLTPPQVAEMAAAVHAAPSFKWWLMDLANPILLKMASRSWGKKLAEGNAPFHFAPEEGTAFFEPFGWRELAYRSIGEEGRRLKRQMRGMWLWRLVGKLRSAEVQEKWKRLSGVVMLERKP